MLVKDSRAQPPEDCRGKTSCWDREAFWAPTVTMGNCQSHPKGKKRWSCPALG